MLSIQLSSSVEKKLKWLNFRLGDTRKEVIIGDIDQFCISNSVLGSKVNAAITLQFYIYR